MAGEEGEEVGEGGVGAVGAPEGVEADGEAEVGEGEEDDGFGFAAGGGGDGESQAGAGGDEAEGGEVGRAFLHDLRSEAVAGAGGEDGVVKGRADGARNPDEAFGFEIDETEAAAGRTGERMGGGNGEDDGVVGNGMVGERGEMRRMMKDESEVQLAGAEQFALDGGGVLDELELDGGEFFAEAAEGAGEDRVINRGIHESDAEAAGAAGGGVAGALGGGGVGAEERAGVVEKGATGGGEADAAWEAFEEGRAEFGLEFADLFAEGGLDDREAGGGAAEVFVFGGGDEVAEVSEFHREITLGDRCGEKRALDAAA